MVLLSQKKNPNNIRDHKFINSVDKPLRKLVRFLHRSGIKTTPSCSGHHIRERSLEKIYDALLEDLEAIRNEGLKLKDVETGRHYFYNDPNCALPWSRQQFLEEVGEYQQKGVIGLRMGRHKKLKQRILNLEIEGTIIKEKDSIVFVFTDEDNKGDNRKLWRRITKAIIKMIQDDIAIGVKSSGYTKPQNRTIDTRQVTNSLNH
jgi:hypothetical protein